MTPRPSSSLRYDAVGVLERWDETCALISRYFPWLEVECATHKNERSTRKKRRTETAATLRPELRAMIERMNAADVALYEAGRAQFEEQLRELGLAPAPGAPGPLPAG